MSHSDDRTRVQHMLDAARRAVELGAVKTRADLDRDDVLGLALTRLLEIFGEAAKHVSPGLREKHASIPWREIAGTRDKLIHGYFDVDYDIVWQIVSRDLPNVVPLLETALANGG